MVLISGIILKFSIRPNTRVDFNTWATNIQNATTPTNIIINVKPEEEETVVEYSTLRI